MRRYMMQDLSQSLLVKDDDLTILQVLNMTDYTEAEVNHIMDMKVGDTYLFGPSLSVLVRRLRDVQVKDPQ